MDLLAGRRRAAVGLRARDLVGSDPPHSWYPSVPQGVVVGTPRFPLEPSLGRARGGAPAPTCARAFEVAKSRGDYRRWDADPHSRPDASVALRTRAQRHASQVEESDPSLGFTFFVRPALLEERPHRRSKRVTDLLVSWPRAGYCRRSDADPHSRPGASVALETRTQRHAGQVEESDPSHFLFGAL